MTIRVRRRPTSHAADLAKNNASTVALASLLVSVVSAGVATYALMLHYGETRELVLAARPCAGMKGDVAAGTCFTFVPSTRDVDFQRGTLTWPSELKVYPTTIRQQPVSLAEPIAALAALLERKNAGARNLSDWSTVCEDSVPIILDADYVAANTASRCKELYELDFSQVIGLGQPSILGIRFVRKLRFSGHVQDIVDREWQRRDVNCYRQRR